MRGVLENNTWDYAWAFELFQINSSVSCLRPISLKIWDLMLEQRIPRLEYPLPRSHYRCIGNCPLRLPLHTDSKKPWITCSVCGSDRAEQRRSSSSLPLRWHRQLCAFAGLVASCPFSPRARVRLTVEFMQLGGMSWPISRGGDCLSLVGGLGFTTKNRLVGLGRSKRLVGPKK